VLDELKAAAKGADAVYLAADPTARARRSAGTCPESLGIKKKAKVQRVIFNEITKKAIDEAFLHPVAVDAKKVDAQQTRRILDRLVGYKVSPDPVGEGPPRTLCRPGPVGGAEADLRPRARDQGLRPREYWSVLAQLKGPVPPSSPPTSSSATARTSRSSMPSRPPKCAARSRRPPSRCRASSPRNAGGIPVPPFITSKLQQEAFKKLRFTVKKTMQVAQRLYEGVELGRDGSVGLITYMRTDSTRSRRMR
jgi:DNA topoisomerase-1